MAEWDNKGRGDEGPLEFWGAAGKCFLDEGSHLEQGIGVGCLSIKNASTLCSVRIRPERRNRGQGQGSAVWEESRGAVYHGNEPIRVQVDLRK